MKEEFKQLEELDKEFKESSLSYSNIPWIDRHEMLTKTVRFWMPGVTSIERDKMQCFCKSSMENWYKNWFEPPIGEMEGKQDKIYLSEERTKDIILDASGILALELIRAFWLELYIKKYIRKLEKRFTKLNNFSKYNLN